MKINCLSCGHNIDLDDAYADHYEGEIKCYACGAGLEIRTEQSAIRSVRLRGLSVDSELKDEERREARDSPAQNDEPQAGQSQQFKPRKRQARGGTARNEGEVEHVASANDRIA